MAALLLPAAILGVIVTISFAIMLSGQLNANTDTYALVKLIVTSAVVVCALCAAPCLLLMGYYVRAIRNVANGVSGLLPAWTDLGGLFLTGLSSCLVALGVTLLPLTVMGFGVAGMSRILLLDRHQQGDALLRMVVSGGGLLFILGLIFTALLAQFLLPMATLRLAMSQSVLTALNPLGIVADIMQGPADYILAVVAVMGLNSVAGGVFSLVPPLMLLWLPFSVYSQLFAANLLGQYWRLHLAEYR